jgi:predicted RNase H-like HicB family nuclease
MTEILFLVEESPEGGYTARAVGQSIFTEADTLAALRANVREAVECHFEDGQTPLLIRLHIVRDEVLAT